MHDQRIMSRCDIGAAIQKRRHQLALSREAFAGLLHVTTQQIQRYESGKDRVSVEKLQAIAHLLSVPLTYFFYPDAQESMPQTDAERELLTNFRKIQNNVSKELVLDTLRKLTGSYGVVAAWALAQPFSALV